MVGGHVFTTELQEALVCLCPFYAMLCWRLASAITQPTITISYSYANQKNYTPRQFGGNKWRKCVTGYRFLAEKTAIKLADLKETKCVEMGGGVVFKWAMRPLVLVELSFLHGRLLPLCSNYLDYDRSWVTTRTNGFQHESAFELSTASNTLIEHFSRQVSYNRSSNVPCVTWDTALHTSLFSCFGSVLIK